MQIKVYHKKSIQNGFFSKSIEEVHIIGLSLTDKMMRSVEKVLDSFEAVINFDWEGYEDRINLIFTVEASTMYNAVDETEPFNKQKGHDIAENKAIIRAYRTAIKINRHIQSIIAREHCNLEDTISSKLSKQIDIRNEIIRD